MSLDEQVDEKVEELKDRDDVRAVALVGSYAREPEMYHNDIDIFVIVDSDWRKRETFVEDDIVWELFFNSMNWAEKYVEDKEEIGYIYHWFKNADIRNDPEGLFNDLEEKAEDKLETLFDIDEDEVLYSIWDFQQDLENEDVGQRRFLMNDFFDYLVRLNYLLNEEALVKKNFRIEKLKDFDGYMHKLSQDFLLESSTMKKEEKLEKIIDHVTKNLGEPNPEWETEKEYFDQA